MTAEVKPAEPVVVEDVAVESTGKGNRRDKRGARRGREQRDVFAQPEPDVVVQDEPTLEEPVQEVQEVDETPVEVETPKRKPQRRAHKTAVKHAATEVPQTSLAFEPMTDIPPVSAEVSTEVSAESPKPAGKRASLTGRARKTSAKESVE